MRAETTRKLLAWHRVCGLIVSLNVALFAVTGAILIFHDEINAALGVVPEVRGAGSEISLGKAIELARASAPKSKPLYVARSDEYPHYAFVGMAEGSSKFEDSKAISVDLTRGEVVKSLDLDNTFTAIVFRVHAQLLMGPAGALLVGVIGLAFLFSLVSGTILYGPMMKRFAFGLLRRDRHVRTFVADIHKLVGIATLGWNMVVVTTGIFLSIGSMLLQFYAAGELAKLAAPFRNEAPVTQLDTVDAAIAEAERTSDGRVLSFVALPGSEFASPRQYAVLLHGIEGLDKRMLTLALVDAKDTTQVVHKEFPLYLQALLVSEPLHFGDYGGMALKVVWALFSLLSLAMAVSGVWVTVSARKQRELRKRSVAVDSDVVEATP
jgi:uncharacterized iron-regulated membrane protein